MENSLTALLVSIFFYGFWLMWKSFRDYTPPVPSKGTEVEKVPAYFIHVIDNEVE